MEDKLVAVIGDIGHGKFRLGPRDADGADEQAKPVLLVGEDVFDMVTDRRFRGIGLRGILRHRFARRLEPVDADDQHRCSRPCLILLRAIGTFRPDLRGGVMCRHQPRQHAAVPDSVAVAPSVNKPATEMLEIDRRLQNLQRIPVLLRRSRCSESPNIDPPSIHPPPIHHRLSQSRIQKPSQG